MISVQQLYNIPLDRPCYFSITPSNMDKCRPCFREYIPYGLMYKNDDKQLIDDIKDFTRALVRGQAKPTLYSLSSISKLELKDGKSKLEFLDASILVYPDPGERRIKDAMCVEQLRYYPEINDEPNLFRSNDNEFRKWMFSDLSNTRNLTHGYDSWSSYRGETNCFSTGPEYGFMSNVDNFLF